VTTTNIKLKSNAPSNVERATKLFDEYGGFIRLIIRFHVGNEPEAEDLFQDLFLSIIARPIPEEVRSIKGFLYKMISDIVKDAFRRTNRYKTRLRRYAECHLYIVDNHPAAGLIDLEETIKMFDLIERHLPTKEAMAVTLKFRDNCDIEEVAEKMGVKTRSVSRYVSIGLKKISNVLDKK
jgi:RNA polymerase sigma factor (sigma-70 family)